MESYSPLIIPLNEPFIKFCTPTSVRDEEQPRPTSQQSEESELLSRDAEESSSPSEQEDESNPVLAQVLDTMFEPRKWTDPVTGTDVTQVVSRVPSNRLDAIHLTKLLDLSLGKYQAKECGICPIRRILYDKTMDEIIRQVTINCIDQGMLLYRIRNEFHMTLEAYKNLFESSVKFGLKYAVRSQKKSVDIEEEKRGILGEKDDLKRKYFQLQKTHEATLGKLTCLSNIFSYCLELHMAYRLFIFLPDS